MEEYNTGGDATVMGLEYKAGYLYITSGEGYYVWKINATDMTWASEHYDPSQP